MSQLLANLQRQNPSVKKREKILALAPEKTYNDGRTKQCHADECNIQKIMARFDVTGTISHLSKYQPVYGDFSDFDFHEQTQKLTRGREIFDALPAELRQEFGQSPAAFFAYVNDPANIDELRKKLPALARPGQQLPRAPSPTADQEAADAAQNATEGSEREPQATETPPGDPPTPQE